MMGLFYCTYDCVSLLIIIFVGYCGDQVIWTDILLFNLLVVTCEGYSPSMLSFS